MVGQLILHIYLEVPTLATWPTRVVNMLVSESTILSFSTEYTLFYVGLVLKIALVWTFHRIHTDDKKCKIDPFEDQFLNDEPASLCAVEI